MSSRSLPALPHWEHVRKQAKDLLADLRANDPAALARAAIYFAVFSPAPVSRGSSAPTALRLSDAQLVVAREYGFASWPRLKQHVEQARAAHQAALPNQAPPIEVHSPDSPQQATVPDASEILQAAPAPEPYPADPQEIRSASWVETNTRWDEDKEQAAFPTYYWIRLNPLALAWHNVYGDSWSHDVIDARGRLHTALSWDHSELSPTLRPYTPDDLLRKVLFPYFPAEESTENQAKELKAWRQDELEGDGQRLTRWQREAVSGNFQVAQTILTEPETRRIVRQERRETNLLTGKLSTVEIRDRYTFNQPAPAGTFEMPPDKPLQTRKTRDIAPEAWEALSPQEQQAVREVIAASDAAWRKADVRAFSAAWKFDFQKNLPRETEWKQRVEQQAGLWSEWNSQVEAANMQIYLPVYYNTHSFMLAMLTRKILRVKVSLHVIWHEGAGDWTGKAEFFLRKHSGRYRIVHWDCPWAEIEAARIKAPGTMGAE